MFELNIYNTLKGQKESFIPCDPSHIRVYACGPTVYNYAHIGNARMAVVFDLLVDVLRALYTEVTYVSNITDVDDKIIAAAEQTDHEISEITKKYTDIYNSDMGALGVRLPDVQPKATEHINDMIRLIELLIERGHAYEAEGHVLFNVPSFKAYGGLSRRTRDDQVAGARVDVAPFKKDPADFVLWKPSDTEQPGWESPWGRGRPGWHIECSAMAERHLGLPFDIHGGGADLKFPHHENEIAQSCCAHGHDSLSDFAKYWIHNGFVTVQGEKMAKSVGNIRLVHELLDNYEGETLRLTLLSAHYRQPLDWSEGAIESSKSLLDRLYNILKDTEDIVPDSTDVPDEFMAALCDDLNTPLAISVINQIAKKLAGAKGPDEIRHYKGQLLSAANMIGILKQDAKEWLGYGQDDEDIDKLLEEREQARKSKDFEKADKIRNILDEKGVVIEDTPQGPKWRKKA
jgi:cysteinyl-tRNA synthetase